MTQDDVLPSISTVAKTGVFDSSLSSTLPAVITSSPLSSAVSISPSSAALSLQLVGAIISHSSKTIVAVDLPTVPAAPPSIVPLDLPFLHFISDDTPAIVALSVAPPLLVLSVF